MPGRGDACSPAASQWASHNSHAEGMLRHECHPYQHVPSKAMLLDHSLSFSNLSNQKGGPSAGDTGGPPSQWAEDTGTAICMATSILFDADALERGFCGFKPLLASLRTLASELRARLTAMSRRGWQETHLCHLAQAKSALKTALRRAPAEPEHQPDRLPVCKRADVLNSYNYTPSIHEPIKVRVLQCQSGSHLKSYKA